MNRTPRLIILPLSFLLGFGSLFLLWTPKLQVNLLLVGLVTLAAVICLAIILPGRHSSRPAWFYLPAVALWLVFLWFLPQMICPGRLRNLGILPAGAACNPPCVERNCACSSWDARPCSGWSVQLNKTVSCSSAGVSQDGFPCLGCCFEYACDCDCPSNNPPSVSGSVTCSVLSSTGWCVDGAMLEMSASDPEGGAVTISGTTLGSSFTCPSGNSCLINLPEGSGAAVFHATDSAGLSSGDFSVGFQFDSTQPSVSPVINGTSGNGGWYISTVAVSSNGSDAVSGILAAQVSVNGGGWQDSAALGDGIYTIVFAALDGAGNEASTTLTVQVDTTAPTLEFNIGGSSPNSDGSYTRPVSIAITAGDSLSGLSTSRLRVDGGDWTDWTGTSISLGAGTYLIEAEAQDIAGNTTSASLEVKVRNPPPNPTKTRTARLILRTRTPTPTITTTETPVDNSLPTAIRTRTFVLSTATSTRMQAVAVVVSPPTQNTTLPQQSGNQSLLLLPLAIAAAGASLALSMGITRRFVSGPVAEAVRISPADAPVEIPGGYSREEDLARKKAEKQAWATEQKIIEAQNAAYQAQHAANLAAAAAASAVGNKPDGKSETRQERIRSEDKTKATMGAGTANAKPPSSKGDISVAHRTDQSNGKVDKNQGETKSLLASIPIIGNTLDNAWQGLARLWNEKVSTPIENYIIQKKPSNKKINTRLAVGGTLALVIAAIGIYGLQQGSIPARDHQDPWWCAYAPNFGTSGKKCAEDFLTYEQGEWQTWFLPPKQIAVVTTPTIPQPCKNGYCVGQTYFTDGGLNIRDSAGGSVLTMLDCGESITVVGGFETRVLDGVEYLWAQVDTDSGLKGVWIAINLFQSSDHEPKSCQQPTDNRTVQEGLIEFQGDGFNSTDVNGIKTAGINIGNAFAEVLGPEYSTEEAWNIVFRNTSITFVETGYDCNGMGEHFFQENNWGGCWAAAGDNGQVLVSTEFINASPSSGEVTEWVSHETGHEIDRLLTQVYGRAGGDWYGANQMAQYPGGLYAINQTIPSQYRQSLVGDRNLTYEVFADAFTCWSHPDCEFTDPNFTEYFNDLMAQFAVDRLNNQ
jgi:hypothetical protein